MKKTKNQNIYNRFGINNYDYAKPIKLLNNPGYKKSTSSDKGIKAKVIIIISLGNNLGQISNKEIKIVLTIKGLILLHKNIKLKKKLEQIMFLDMELRMEIMDCLILIRMVFIYIIKGCLLL